MNLLAFVPIGLLYLHFAIADDQRSNIFLVQAVDQGKVDIIRWLIAEGADINVQDNNGKTPLMHGSVISNSSDMVKYLIASGADTEIKQYDGKTALHLAAEIDARDVVQIIFENMNKSNITDDQGRCALHSAVISGGTNVLSYLIEQGMDVNMTDLYGFTAMHIAAQQGRVPALGRFFDTNMDVNLATSNGTTPFILATKYGHLKAAEYLLNRGANVDAQDTDGWSALHIAAHSGNIELVNLLISNNASLDQINSDGRTPLHLAVSQGHYGVAEFLSNAGANIKICDKYGNSLLHAAAKSGNTQLIHFLYRGNIKINEKNKNGDTPLVLASKEGHNDAVKFLIKKGADFTIFNELGLPFIQRLISRNYTEILRQIFEIQGILLSNFKDAKGATLLHFASSCSNKEMVNYILDIFVLEYVREKESSNPNKKLANKNSICFPCYVSVANIKDMYGDTALHYAARNGNSDAADILLSHGAYQHVTDTAGQTPFHIAASHGQTEILNTLALHHSDINTVDKNGKTAIFLSAEGGYLNSVKYLIEIGADTTIEDSRKWSLMHIAAANGYTDILRELLDLDIHIVLKLFLEDDEGKSPAWYAVNNGHLDILFLLKNHGFPIEEKDFCEIVRNGHYDIIKNEALANLVFSDNTNSANLLHSSASKGLTNIVETLSKYPCFLNSRDEENKTALWYAIDAEKWDTVNKLEQEGAIVEPNVTMIEAVRNNQTAFVKYLLKKGISVDSKDEGGWPVIFLSALYGHTEITHLLLENGVGVDSAIPGWRWTPFHAAAWVGHCGTVQLLLKHGASRRDISSFGYNAWDVSKPSCKHLF